LEVVGRGLGRWDGGGLLFTFSATTQEEIDDLLQAEGDDQANADRDEVEKHVVGSEHRGVRSWYRRFSIPLAVGLTLAAAAFSYHFFERPILKFKERFETIHTRPA
jgi:hypothetical protein